MSSSNQFRSFVIGTLWCTTAVTLVLTGILLWPMYRDYRVATELIRMPTDVGSLEFFRRVDRLIEDKSGCRFVISMLAEGTKHSDPRIRWRSVMGLGKFSEARKELYPELIEALSDEEKQVRMSASGWLGKAPSQAIPRLLVTLESPNPRLRAGVLEALGSMGSDAAETVFSVREHTTDDDAGVREYAVWALGRMHIDDPETIKCLVHALEDSEPKVQLEAVKAFASFDLSDPTPILRMLLHDDAAISQWASYALRNQTKALGQMRVITNLLEALHDNRQNVRVNAVCALGRLGASAKGSVSELESLLKDENPELRFPAARSIWQITQQIGDVLPTICETLRDELSNWRWAALVTLLEMGADAGEAVPVLVELANKPSEYQWQAVEILKINRGRPELVVPALVEALNSPEIDVQRAAASALAGYGPDAKDALPKLRKLSQDTVMQDAAKQAIAAIDPGSERPKHE